MTFKPTGIAIDADFGEGPRKLRILGNATAFLSLTTSFPRKFSYTYLDSFFFRQHICHTRTNTKINQLYTDTDTMELFIHSLLLLLFASLSHSLREQLPIAPHDSLEVPGKNPLLYCQDPKDYILDIYYIELAPNPPKA